MKQKIIITVIALTMTLAAAESASAIGLGFSITGGMCDNTIKMADRPNAASATLSQYYIGAGLILDTAAAKNELFNYRLNLGYQNVIGDGVDFFDRFSYHRLQLCNTFGLGFYRSDIARIYIGPQLMLSYDFKYNSYGKTRLYTIRNGSSGNTGVDDPIVMGYLGLVFGFNIHAGNNATFTMDLGGRVGYGGFVTGPDFRVTRLEAFTNIGFMYRIGDTFAAANRQINLQIEADQPAGEKKQK